jgi:fumarylacetoacetase
VIPAATPDETHDPARRSWLASANAPGADFPLQNLPFGVFRSGTLAPRIGVAIGTSVLDLHAALEAGVLELALPMAEACCAARLNGLMELGAGPRRELRRAVHALLADGSRLAGDRVARERVLLPVAEVELLRPADVGDYTDFYASIDHATNVGSMFRPEAPLLPNYKWVPIGYHGRASSVVASGSPVRRPLGQTKAPDRATPSFGPARQLDYELEVGAWVAEGNALGEPIPLAEAETHLFGVSLLNDWSARDIQAWEYQPLGPFLAKNFLTTVAPWVVAMEALAPFRVPAPSRPAGEPALLPHLDDPGDRAAGALALTLEVRLASARMREEGVEPVRVSRSDFARMYWTLGQLVAHHASNGCNLRPGDLLGSGTVSGPERDQRGCLLELTWRGKEPLVLPTGERRGFLEDGDEVLMTGWCARPGAARIGLGECRGVVRPAPER